MKDFWKQGQWKTSFDNQLSHEIWTLTSNNGKGSSSFFNLSSGMKLSITEYEFLNSQKFSVLADSTRIGFYFCLYGNARIILRDAESEFVQTRGQSGLFIRPGGSEGTLSIPKGNRTRIISVDMPIENFYGYLGLFGNKVPQFITNMVDKSGSGFVSCSFAASPNVRMVADQILNLKIPMGLGGGLLLEAKALELISGIIIQAESQTRDSFPKVALCKREIEGIHHVKDILQLNMATPPSLGSLACSAGMNRLKLNQGFRQVFGLTVFGLLREIRLETARKILENGQMNVTETSFFVGYSCLSHFTKAFKEQYGITPKQCLSKTLH